MPALKDLPGPTAKMRLEEGPLDGLTLDWTPAGSYPIEMAFEFVEFLEDGEIRKRAKYEASFHYLEGERLADGIPANETQVYYHEGTEARKVEYTQEEIERRKLWHQENDEGSST